MKHVKHLINVIMIYRVVIPKTFYLFIKNMNSSNVSIPANQTNLYGPSFWRFIHYYAMSNNVSPINALKQILPDDWKTEWIDYSPNDTSYNSLKEWSMQFHNRVNKKLGKYSNWDLIDFDIGHKDSCDFCENNQNIFHFPWGFLFQISLNSNNISNENIIQILKYFNETYPHQKCRGRYLIDIPHDSESLIDWISRNNKRMNNEFNFFDNNN